MLQSTGPFVNRDGVGVGARSRGMMRRRAALRTGEGRAPPDARREPVPESVMIVDKYHTYGNKSCPRCGRVHDAALHVRESRGSRFRTLQFAAEMMAYAGPARLPRWTDGATRGEKLAALRSMRNGLPLAQNANVPYGGRDIAERVCALLAGRPDGMTASEIEGALQPTKTEMKTIRVRGQPNREELQTLPVKSDAFLNQVLMPLVASGNVRVTAEKPKRFVLRSATNPGLSGAVTANATGEFMLGLLVCPEKTFVAASGSGLANNAFQGVAAMKGYTVCTAVSATTHPRRSLIGTQITEAAYAATRAPNAPEPGNCAAPRLLQMAFRDPAVDKRRHAEWQMSEIFYLPGTDARSRRQNEGLVEIPGGYMRDASKDLYWTHGATAESCATCDRLVPLLLCPAGDLVLVS